MDPTAFFINPDTGLLRSGWRAFLFLMLARAPEIVIGLLVAALSAGASESNAAEAAFGSPAQMIPVYAFLVIWLLFLSWLCLRFLERLPLSSLGYHFHRGWWRDLLLGCGVAAVMMTVIVGLQWIGGGTRIIINPILWQSVADGRAIDWMGVWRVAGQMTGALVLFILAGSFEELLFRGYGFQTLLRAISPVIPILLLSLYFGVAHLGNPSATTVSTANTVLAGVWLSVAYLKTRSLWFATALHFTWNWMMGAFFGLPVSGLKLIDRPFLLSTSENPVWLTGGDYGSEGGLAVTAILLIATLVIWRAKWLHRAAPENESRTPDLAALQLEVRERPASDSGN